MTEVRCGQCAAVFELPEGYTAPYIKCPGCGSHQKNPAVAANEPVYRILDHSGRQRAAAQPVSPAEPENEETKIPEPVQKRPHLAPPAMVPQERRQAASATRIDHKMSGRPVGEKKILEDALGKNGMEMVLQLVAGYMDELDESRRRVEKTKAMQALMRAKFPAELAARAVEYAEKSPEINELIWANYFSALRRGVMIFSAGILLSLVVYFAANPGRELVFFQLPFAVGLAYTCNSLLGMVGLKYPALRRNSVHYAFLSLASLLILFYIIWGMYF
ncbi:MAG: hypothetical protein PHD82_15875 [Candidatus Riflebacteria bacterium]|nr:hypothetical protein [Candidatus Riflebacteria bacterium]